MITFLRKENFLISLFLSLTIIIYFIFGFYNITKFITYDESLWIYERIPQYWDGIRNIDLEKTYINDKPGVIVALISGAGLLFDKNPQENIQENNGNLTIFDSTKTERLLLIFRLPILIFNLILSLLLFLLIKKLTENNWIALWSFILILLNPILLGMARIINPDSFLWSFSFLSILCFYLFLKSLKKKFAIFSGFFLGLSLLSKYTAIILFPFLFFNIILWLVFNWDSFNKNLIKKKIIIQLIISYFILIITSFIIFCLLMPAIFVNYNNALDGFVKNLSGMNFIFLSLIGFPVLMLIDAMFLNVKFLNYFIKLLYLFSKYWIKLIFFFIIIICTICFINYQTNQYFFDLERFPFDLKRDPVFANTANLFEKILVKYRVIVFSIMPISFFLIIYLWIMAFFKKIPYFFLVFSLSFFIIIFNFALIFQNLVTKPRYSIILYPILAFLTAIGIHVIIEKHFKKFIEIKKIISILIIFISFLTLFLIKPFYSMYTSSLLPKKYIMNDMWGFGGYEAATYLNDLPNSEELVVWSDYPGACAFFKGKCFSGINAYFLNKDRYNFNYLVLTRRGNVFYNKAIEDNNEIINDKFINDLGKIYFSDSFDWEFAIDNRPEQYVRLYKYQ